MKIEDQVTSLELSKKLKELGFEQDSLFYWYVTGKHFCMSVKIAEGKPYLDYGKTEVPPFPEKLIASAFTVAELGEMLPLKIKSYRYYSNTEWRSVDEDELRSANTQIATFEANARAKMLIYLIENKHIGGDDETD